MTRNDIYPIGEFWRRSSLLWGTRGGEGEQVDVVSPANGLFFQRVSLLSSEEVAQLITLVPFPPARAQTDKGLREFADRLHTALSALRPLLVEAMQLETAFVAEDCEELVQESLTYVAGFGCCVDEKELPETMPQIYRQARQMREIHLVRAAWGTVVVILPQNAFLLLAVTSLLNALAAGNRVILRAPLQSARSAALLARAIEIAQPPENAVSVILTRAKEFLASLYQSSLACLLHYMGSSRHAPHILSDAFRHGKAALIDGEGNGWVWVGADACPEMTTKLLTSGALRYNGQTCTSINGAMIHPALYSQVRELLIKQWKTLRAGSPLAEAVDVGPLFDVAQAEWCEQQIASSGSTILYGGERQGNLLMPTLVERPASESALVREGLFGPALWIAPGDAALFVNQWQQNRYPLCAGVLSPSVDSCWWHTHLQNLARLVVNGDMSQEFLFEPWGGYPGSGMNPVGSWKEKYRRMLQVDVPIR